MKAKAIVSRFNALLQDRAAYEEEWIKVSKYLLPGRQIYRIGQGKTIKRKLSNNLVINPAGRKALRFLTAFMQGGLTSPGRKWFDFKFKDSTVEYPKELTVWLQKARDICYSELATSNFYQVMHAFYGEFAGFATGTIFSTEGELSTLRFELPSVGEYAIVTNEQGKLDEFYQIRYFPLAKLKRIYKRLPEDLKEAEAGNLIYYTVLKAIYKKKYKDKDYKCKHLLLEKDNFELKVAGYYEMPAFTGRWTVLSGDEYGLGPGIDAMPNIMRLQQVEKAFLAAVHKAIDPPLAVSPRLKGHVNTLPGGRTYVNPEDRVEGLIKTNLEYTGVSASIQAIEQSIGSDFYNDVILLASRDPNASPLRTGEVNERNSEKLIQLGPVIERVLYEVLSPLLERVFNTLLRAGKFPPIDPALLDSVGEFEIQMVSPLAQAQKALAAGDINRFLQMAAAVIQYNPQAGDWIDTDQTLLEMADISGIPAGMIRDKEQVDQLRKHRADQQRAQAEAQAKLEQEQHTADINEKRGRTAASVSQAVAHGQK